MNKKQKNVAEYIKAMKIIYTKPTTIKIATYVPRKVRAKETKPRKRTEGELGKRIENDLNLLELQEYVIAHDRLNSGMAQRGIYWVKLCKEGTADRIIYCPDRVVIFLETKGNGVQTPEQIAFMEKMTKAGHLYFLVKNYEEWQLIRNQYIYKE